MKRDPADKVAYLIQSLGYPAPYPAEPLQSAFEKLEFALVMLKERAEKAEREVAWLRSGGRFVFSSSNDWAITQTGFKAHLESNPPPEWNR